MYSTRSRLVAWPLAARPCALLACIALATLAQAADDKKPAAPKAALTVTVTQPQATSLLVRIQANGSIAAWQEASVGTEANGLRLAEVRVNVGDVVKRGQVLASFAPDTLQADAAQARASVAEAEATLADAAANAQRARSLQATGALSDAAINQYLTAERTAQARVEAQRAMARMQQLRLKQAHVLAPDAGVISSRSATVGADARLTEVKVKVGRRVGDRVEVTSGVDAATRVVASGGGFLADGDTVRVVEGPAR